MPRLPDGTTAAAELGKRMREAVVEATVAAGGGSAGLERPCVMRAKRLQA